MTRFSKILILSFISGLLLSSSGMLAMRPLISRQDSVALPSPEKVHSVIVYLSPEGFKPPTIQFQSGRFMLIVRMDRESKFHEFSVKQPGNPKELLRDEERRSRSSNWATVLELPPGDYGLRDVDSGRVLNVSVR